MGGVIVTKAMDVPSKHWEEHTGFAYDRRILIPKGAALQCQVALYSIPPGMSAFPYHYHVKNEECYYILSGTGILRTPEGEQTVCAGHFVFFPADETGAHKMTNPSPTEPWSIWILTRSMTWRRASTRTPARLACGARTLTNCTKRVTRWNITTASDEGQRLPSGRHPGSCRQQPWERSAPLCHTPVIQAPPKRNLDSIGFMKRGFLCQRRAAH